ncbi:hypothetical protein BRC75_03335 [Halobacteriales archaeon QH_7_69_31]|nr:MAG: hypothetical protein BRC75_03335 [Halobacteriales archaeon QH_7_69_31]
MRRRRLLVAASAGLASTTVAGCLDDGPGGDGSPDGETPTGSDVEPTDTATGTPTASANLDLREANVTGVEVEPKDDDYRFAVTLLHDDDGEDGYANWWQVETLDGRRLGRRDLAHAHGTREFTRSTTVSVPSAVDCVVVRGHDRTHGYGGQAALVAPKSGAERLRRQGREPAEFAPGDCP